MTRDIRILDKKHNAVWLKWLNRLMIVMSLVLVVYLSYDSFNHIDFHTDKGYLQFQFWVCTVFMADFIAEMALSTNKWHYFKKRWIVFVLSVPYLNIIHLLPWTLPVEAYYFIRFVPLARGALAMFIIVRAVTTNRLTGVFLSYSVLLIAIVYFGSLTFMELEQDINPQVGGFGSALWWACSDATTTGCDINPMTVGGKVIGCVLAIMGMIMFPLFTVFITTMIRRNFAKA